MASHVASRYEWQRTCVRTSSHRIHGVPRGSYLICEQTARNGHTQHENGAGDDNFGAGNHNNYAHG